MDDGELGDYSLVSHTAASLSQVTLYNLKKGNAYRFKVLAGNFN